jgi:hypothetical protein
MVSPIERLRGRRPKQKASVLVEPRHSDEIGNPPAGISAFDYHYQVDRFGNELALRGYVGALGQSIEPKQCPGCG